MKQSIRKFCLTALLAAVNVMAWADKQYTLKPSEMVGKATDGVAELGAKVANLSSAIIGVAGLVFIGWNGFKYLKGNDPQSQDTLLKIGGGMVAFALVIQLIKSWFNFSA